MLEFERMFLAKSLPAKLEECKKKEILDIYLPQDSHHPVLRIRKNGDKYEMTKKEVVSAGVFKEQTITLTPEEFDALAKTEGKRVHKVRYFYPHNDRILEIGVFQGALKGLVLIDVEFASEEDMKTALDIGNNKVPQEWTTYVNNVKQNGISAIRPIGNAGQVSLYNFPLFDGGVPMYVIDSSRSQGGKQFYTRVGLGPNGLISEEVEGADTPRAKDGHTYILIRKEPRNPRKRSY